MKVDVVLEDRPLEPGEWRLVDDQGLEHGRAPLAEAIVARVSVTTTLYAEIGERA